MDHEYYKERIKVIDECWKSVAPTLDLAKKQKRIKELQSQTLVENFWDNVKTATQITHEISQIEKNLQQIQYIEETLSALQELIDTTDKNDLSLLLVEIEALEPIVAEWNTRTKLSGEFDASNAILSLSTGNGGQDAEDFSQILLRMYMRWAESRQFSAKILSCSESSSGIKSATLLVEGPFAYGLLRSEHGTHRLIRLSPFNAKNLRQTSFSRVEVLPLRETTEFTINEKDLRIDVFRSSGAGGQSVNTTDSAVRITYLPLGISVSCQNERSQLQNKQAALKILTSRLIQLQKAQEVENLSEIRGELLENSFGSQIRTYTLQPYKLVKDHRSGYEEHNPDGVFEGRIDGFIDHFLTMQSSPE